MGSEDKEKRPAERRAVTERRRRSENAVYTEKSEDGDCSERQERQETEKKLFLAARRDEAEVKGKSVRQFKICFLSSNLVLLSYMKKIIQVHIYKGDKYFIAECIDLPVVTQGKTLDELSKNLEEAISLQLEGENLADFDLVEKPSVLASFEIEPRVYAKA